MLLWIKLIIVALTLCYSSALKDVKYDLNFVGSDNLLIVNGDFDASSIQNALNSKYNIGADEMIDVGLSPFSTLYMIHPDREYTFDFSITSSYELSDVEISLDANISDDNFIVSQPMSMRGVDLLQLNFYPLIYNASTNTATIIEQVEIKINEQAIENTSSDNHIVPLSREFEKLLSSMVVNLDITDRTTDDSPSILFVCGGNSIDNSYLQDLIQWRREQGYKVFTVNTSETGTDANNIKDYIENAYFTWDFPPEYVVLVGDTSGAYTIGWHSADWGESDYPYTLFDGNDLLPEMFVGRISANSSSDLSNIINKTLAYEKASFIEYTGTDWYESSGLVGDPSATGNSAIITNEYIENILNVYDFNDVGTCYGCSYTSWMSNRLEEGILYFNYRGYIGTSGFGSNHIDNANNGYMTPFVTFITCSTGGFSGTSIAESFLRAGSVANPKGGVAAVGTATSSTHTVPNNIVDMGIYDGIFAKDVHTAGGALVSGKLSLFNIYPQNPSNMVYKFTHWNNLMGDPVLSLWTDTPEQFIVDYPEFINMGTNSFSINVADEDGNAVEDAKVVIFIDESNVFYAYTDEDGDAEIFTENEMVDSATITVLKRNFIPFSNSVSVSNQQMHIELSQDYFSVDDSNLSNSGPSDGIANPGEIVDLYLFLQNYSMNTIENLDAYVSTNSSKIDFIEDSFSIDYLDPQQESMVGPFTLYLHDDIVASDLTDLVLTIQNQNDGLSDWNFIVPFDVVSPDIVIQSSQYSVFPTPGQTIDLNMTFTNTGNQELGNCYMNIDINNSLIDFVQSESYVGNIYPGQVATNQQPIVIEFSDNIIDGSIFNFDVNLYNQNGFSQNITLNVSVGIANEHDPLGPDTYGYYIYDSTDLGYSLTPFYDWIELDPSQGGDGIDLGISDSGNGNNITNSTKYIELPFIFTFYGEEYDEVSVNANGWISFGHSNMESFRNYQLPGAGGPSPMVAAFWDDLKTNASSKVLKYVSEDYVVIEWLNMKTYQHNDTETFQIILYNSMTPTGDDEIKIQYKEFNNTTNGDYTQYTPYHGCYATVGIENHLSTVGLEYTFDNNYPVAAAPLQDESAIFITTQTTTVLTAGDVNQDEEINVLDIIMVINHILVESELDALGQFVADMDNNETINILDVIIIINLILDE